MVYFLTDNGLSNYGLRVAGINEKKLNCSLSLQMLDSGCSMLDNKLIVTIYFIQNLEAGIQYQCVDA